MKYVHRREIFWDWRAEQPDLSDARYLIRRRWLDLEHAIALMPQYASLFRMTTGGWAGFDPLLEQDSRLVQSWEIERDTRIEAVDWRDIQRLRICLYEIWYRKWVRGYTITLPNGTVMEADFRNPRHNEAIVAGIAQARANPTTTVVYIRNDRYHGVPGYDSWWDVPPAEVSTSPEVQQKRAEWQQNRIRERDYLG